MKEWERRIHENIKRGTQEVDMEKGEQAVDSKDETPVKKERETGHA